MRISLIIAACITSLSLHAQIWEFDLGGLAGSGLRGGNEPGVATPSPATGGELNQNFPGDFPSITYNVATRQLRVPIGWGSDNGFVDLTGTYSAWHIHGAVASNPGDDVNDYFTRNAPPLPYTFNVPQDQSTDGSRRTASIDQTFLLTDLTIGGNLYTVDQQVADLKAGRWYINVHSTPNYGGGEIRGQLLYVIPEPQHYAAIAGVALLGFAGYRKYRKTTQPA